jgi:ribosomal-protein-alanine N-acetyltransferase
MFAIREFEPTDMFSVIKLASDTLPERYSPSLFNYFYETFPEGFIVAEEAHKIVGFLIGVRVTTENAKVLMLSVSKQHRKQGIGSELLIRFLKEISKKKVKIVELEVRTDNEKAINFYRKHGFIIKAKIKGFYQNGKTAYTMSKQL